LNFALYPPGVTEVVGIEPERYLRDRARAAAATASTPITVLDGRAESASRVVTGTFDAAVFSLMLCSVNDPDAVLHETKKVLKDGAEVRLYEHVVSDKPGTARLQRLFGPVWSWMAGGCQPDRDTLALAGEQFELIDARTFDFCPGCRIPLGIVAPHILVRAIVGPGSET
jgi:SAM-dependent methyltransferase